MIGSRTLATGAAIVALAYANVSRADGPSAADSALAQTLFDQAVTFMDKGDYANACPKLAESQRLDPAGGTLQNIGFCREKEGKIASAWIAYNESLSQAIKDGRADREATARSRIAAIGDRVSKVVVVVPPEVGSLVGLEVRLDQTPLRQAAWGVPTPIDKGEHELTVEAKGKLTWKTKVRVPEDGMQVSANVEPLKDAPVADIVVPEGPAPRASYRPVAFAIGGVGIVSILAGSVTGVLAMARRSASDNECPNNQCTQRGVDLNEQAKTMAWISDVTVGVGIAALGAAVILFIASPKSTPARAWFAPGGPKTASGLSFGASF